MGKLKLLLLALALSCAIPAFSQTITGISIDTAYHGTRVSFEIYGSGTEFTKPIGLGNGTINKLHMHVNNHAPFDLVAVNDSLAIATIDIPHYENWSGDAGVVIAMFTTQTGPSADTLFYFPLYVRPNSIEFGANYFNLNGDGKLRVDIVGKNTHFTVGTIQAHLCYGRTTTNDCGLSMITGAGAYDTLAHPQAWNRNVEVVNDTLIRIHDFFAVTYDACHDSVRMKLYTQFGEIKSAPFKFTDCPEIVRTIPDSLSFGHNSMQLVGKNTFFTAGTREAKLHFTWLRSGVERNYDGPNGIIYMDVINDTLANVEFDFFPNHFTHNGDLVCDGYGFQVLRPFGIWFSDPWEPTSNSHCYEFEGIHPRTAYRGQPVDISITGENINFVPGTYTLRSPEIKINDPIGNNFLQSYITNVDNPAPNQYSFTMNLTDSARCGKYAIKLMHNNSRRFVADTFFVDCGSNISGQIFYDIDSNGIKDSLDYPMQGVLVSANPGNHLAWTNVNGRYFMNLPPGTYTIEAHEPKGHVSSIPPYNQTIAFGDTLLDIDFGMLPDPNLLDLGVQLTGTPAVNGFFQNFNMRYKNYGVDQYDVVVTLDLDSLVTFESAFITPDVVSAHHLEWHIDTLRQNEGQRMSIYTQTDTLDPSFLGTPVQSIATIYSDSPDADSIDNVKIFDEELVGSYDPNDKLVQPFRSATRFDDVNYTLFDEKLEYTIRFQNTGNYQAFNIRVEDTLDANLDLSTFEFLAASHDVEYNLNAAGELSFFFRNIMLPDSATDERGSHGYVTFSISPKASLAEGTEIENTAHIYFDFNPAIVTNTVNNNFVSEIPLDSIPPIDTTGPNDTTGLIIYGSFSNEVLVQPNPFTNQTLIQFPNPEGTSFHLRVIDLTGRLVHEKLNIQSTQVVFERKGLTNGLYLIELQGDKTYRRKVIIE